MHRPKLDLHGCHIHEAWKKVAKFLESCYYTNYTNCEIICGQGAIKQEIEQWLDLNSNVQEYRLNTRTQGSYNIKLRKKRIRNK